MSASRNLRVENAQKSKPLLLQALDNQPGTARDIVALNTGAALYTAGLADSVAGGGALARTRWPMAQTRQLEHCRTTQKLKPERSQGDTSKPSSPANTKDQRCRTHHACRTGQAPPNDAPAARPRPERGDWQARRRVIAESEKPRPAKVLIPRRLTRLGSRANTRAGCRLPSVLTTNILSGHKRYLQQARAACALPVIRKIS